MREIEVNPKQMLKGLPLQQRVAVDNYPHGGSEGLVADARVATIRDLMFTHGGAVRTPEDFEKLLAAVKPAVAGEVRRTIVELAPALVRFAHIASELEGWTGPAIDDMTAQLEFLLPAQAISIHGAQRLRHLPRYLHAMTIRLEEMNRDPDRDADRQDEIQEVEKYLDDRLAKLPANRRNTREVKDIRWQIQELRVSLFAQRLGTPKPVSAQRVRKMVDKLR